MTAIHVSSHDSVFLSANIRPEHQSVRETTSIIRRNTASVYRRNTTSKDRILMTQKMDGKDAILKIIIIIIIIIMKNFNRQFQWSPWLKAPRTGATHTLMWIARIHSHTYINTVVATSLCKVPAQLLQNLETNFNFS